MNFYVLSWLMFFLAPGGCPIYSIDLSTLEVQSNDFQNELTLQSMLNSELRQYRNGLNERLSGKPLSFDKFIDPPGPKVPLPVDLDLELKHPEWLLDVQRLRSGERSVKESDSDFLGTNLFSGPEKHCFSTEDIALMSARRDFELLVPKSYPNQCMISDSVVKMLIRYFNTVNQIVKKMSDDETRRLLQMALYDSLGGYLRFYLVPAAQMSFYAGRLKLNTVESLVKLYRQCRTALNTNGNGWRSPSKDIVTQFKMSKIEPLKPPKSGRAEDDASCCAFLDQSQIKAADQGQMIVPLPCLEAMDENGNLNNIYLPFRKKRIYNLRAPRSAFIVVKFFETLTNCHRFQGINQAEYNRRLLSWIRENVQLHYTDEQFYPGLGGILQIEQTILSQKQPEEKCEKEEEEKRAKEEEEKCEKADNAERTEYTEKTEEEKCETEEPEMNEEEIDSAPREDTRKLSRSANHWKIEEKHPKKEHHDQMTKTLEGEEPTSEVEQCRECDNDDTLIWCIAAFLALLLLLILLIICCCMRKGRKKKPVDEEAGHEKPKKKKEEHPEEKPRDEPHEKEKTRKDRAYYSGSSRFSGKSQSQDPNGSRTSSSSIACQFNRKCMPLSFHSKGDHNNAEKHKEKRRKRDAMTKVLPSFVSTDSSPRSMLRSPPGPLPMRSPSMSAHSEYPPNTDSDDVSRERERKMDRVYGVDSRQLRRKQLQKGRRETTGSSEDKKDSSPERRRPSRVKIETDESTEDRNLVRKLSREKAKPKESKTRLKGGADSVKESPSWETTFEDS
ncbi:uncharacterized protein LOC6499074 isoform X2 [Drosophila ananassae]|uniref:uncharacterized protein LOC6499074 isoform X2 n=1 Tax=Drosophila ananassae TaxID=7217 RepID=UPI0013A5DEDB|nr:uncharacterized protein LOC6499074 isoform X2 [Drosophila ananassae]